MKNEKTPFPTPTRGKNNEKKISKKTQNLQNRITKERNTTMMKFLPATITVLVQSTSSSPDSEHGQLSPGARQRDPHGRRPGGHGVGERAQTSPMRS